MIRPGNAGQPEASDRPVGSQAVLRAVPGVIGARAAATAAKAIADVPLVMATAASAIADVPLVTAAIAVERGGSAELRQSRRGRSGSAALGR